MNDIVSVPKAAPVRAGWILLGIAWLLFLIPFPGLGIVGWVVNFAAFILAIFVLIKGRTGAGVAQLICSIVASLIVYFIGVALFLAILGETSKA